jgi:tripartite-type tricarboxylate transporter receptor subunit TctC
MITRAILRAAAALSMVCAMTGPALSQAPFPSRTVTIVNPYPAGGGADIVARAVAKELSQEWGQPVVVENRPGAGTTIAAAYVARAPADGHTLLLSTTQHAIAPAIFKSLPYDYLSAFAPIAILSDSPFFLVVRPERGLNSVDDVVRELRQKGGAMNFSSSGPGSLPHLAGAFLNQLTGASATHVPFAGTAPALTALLGGQVDFLFADTSALPSIQAGKAKALATTSAGRSPVLPAVPAVRESIAGFEMTVWTALEAPAGTPPAVINRIHESVYRALALPSMVRMFAENSRQVVQLKPAQFQAFKQAEVQKYAKLARDAGLKVE